MILIIIKQMRFVMNSGVFIITSKNEQESLPCKPFLDLEERIPRVFFSNENPTDTRQKSNFQLRYKH